MSIEILKADAFGRIELCRDGAHAFIRRDTNAAHIALRWFARLAAAREAKVLRALTGIAGVPQLLAFDGRVLIRSFLEGAPMQQAKPCDLEYFHAAHRLLRRLRARGLAHNDLAKEPNWLVLSDGTPGIVDFQISVIGRRRSAWFRLLAREDLRHLLKHKRSYCPQALTPTERRLLARRSWIARTWQSSGKRLYKLVARRLFGYWDNEGRGAPQGAEGEAGMPNGSPTKDGSKRSS